MSLRIISGVTGAIFVIAILLFNNRFLFLINIFVAIIAALSMTEIFKVMGITNLLCITLPSIFFVSILPIIGDNLLWQACYYIYTVTIMSVMVFNRKLKLKDIALVYMMTMVITLSLSKITVIRDYGQELGSFYVLLTLGTAWMSDTGAYFCGKYWGKKKLCPQISPKKTVEGVIGGIITCVLSLLLVGFIFNNLIFSQKYQINYFALAVLGLTGSPISALGDLCFSVIKRSCHVKDFGNAIPGHGGILDRFDSVIFVAPYVYLFLRCISIV